MDVCTYICLLDRQIYNFESQESNRTKQLPMAHEA